MPVTKSYPNIYDKLGSGMEKHVNPPNPVVDTPIVTFATRGGTSMTWDRTPGYFSKKAAKVRLATLPFSYSKSRREMPKGNFHRVTGQGGAQYVDYTGQISQSNVGAPNWSLPAFSSMAPADIYSLITSSLSASLLSGIKDSKVNLAQAFAERKQTADLVTATATRLAKAYSQLRHGNLPGALNQLGAGAPSLRQTRKFNKNYGKSADNRASTAWLEIQYGWLPLLSDVYGSAEFLAQLNNTRQVSQKISRRGQREFDMSYVHFGGLQDGVRVVETHKGTLNYKASVTFAVTNQAAKDISATGISNPLELAWELLPYSFVVDWFLPVGNFISAFDATAGCTFLSGTRSFKLTDVFVGKADGTGQGASNIYTGSGESRVERDELGRQGFSTWPPNNLPQLKNPLSLVHMANALALLNLAFRK